MPDGTYDVRVGARNAAGTGAYHQANSVRVTAKYKIKEHKTLPADVGFRGTSYDKNGNMYVLNEYETAVQRFDEETQSLTTIYGSYGTGVGQMRSPEHMVIGPDDRFYIGDSRNDRIHIVEADGTLVATFGTPGSGDGQFDYITRLTFDDKENLYVADYSKVQKFDKNGVFIERVATELTDPTAVAFDSQNNMFIMNDSTDPAAYGIHKYDSSGNKLHKFASEGEGPGQFYSTYYLLIDKQDNILVADVWNGHIHIFDNDGNLIESFGRYAQYEDTFTEWPLATYEEMSSFDLMPDGNIILSESYWADFPGYTIFELTDNTSTITAPSEPLNLTADTSAPKKNQTRLVST